MLLSELAQAALRLASEMSEPRSPGPCELLAAINRVCSERVSEAREVRNVLRSGGIGAELLGRACIAHAGSNELLGPVLSRAERLRQLERTEQVTCRHLLLAVLQQPTPELQTALGTVSVSADVLFAKALTISGKPVQRVGVARQRKASAIESRLGQLIDTRYEVMGGAQGGMGHVFFCKDRETGQAVALKICADTASPQLFLEEARKWVLLGAHPHIVQALFAGWFRPETAPRPIRHVIPVFVGEDKPAGPPRSKMYIVLEMIANSTSTGCSLWHWLADRPEIPSRALLRWMFQIAGALEYASVQHGMIHQDIKPGNILITPSGDAKLTDFGLASWIARERVFGGTPAYMAPEHRAGRPSVRSDIYSFGVTLAECFLRHIRHEYLDLIGSETLCVLSQGQLALLMAEGGPSSEGYSPRLCEALARVVKICTNADPAKRFARFEELRLALAEIARTHLGMQLECSESRLEVSPAGLTNRAIALLQLRPRAEDKAAKVIPQLLQGAVQSPDSSIALLWLRHAVSEMNSRQILHLSWQHLKLGVRTLGWWLRMLAVTAVLALLLYFSPTSGATKVSVVALALVLGVAAYVFYLSAKFLSGLTIATYVVCVLLYLARWYGSPAHLRWTDEAISMASGLGVWVLGLAERFYGARNLFSFRPQWKRALRLGSLAYWLPIMLFLGGVRALCYLMLESYFLLPLFRRISKYRCRRYVEMQLERGIYLAQPQEALDLSLVFPAGFDWLFAIVIVLLYVPARFSEALDAYIHAEAAVFRYLLMLLG